MRVCVCAYECFTTLAQQEKGIVFNSFGTCPIHCNQTRPDHVQVAATGFHCGQREGQKKSRSIARDIRDAKDRFKAQGARDAALGSKGKEYEALGPTG